MIHALGNLRYRKHNGGIRLVTDNHGNRSFFERLVGAPLSWFHCFTVRLSGRRLSYTNRLDVAFRFHKLVTCFDLAGD